jgi:hypothetical protein
MLKPTLRLVLPFFLGIIGFSFLSVFVLSTHAVGYGCHGPLKFPVRIIAAEPQRLTIKVPGEKWQPDDQGNVEIIILGYCTRYYYLLGIKYSETSPRTEPIVEILENGRLLKRLSINDIESLARDDNGSYELVL